MKIDLDGVLVVEGKQDACFLSSLFNCEIIPTGGYALPKEELAYIKALSASYRIIILTDSDPAGEEIRECLKIRNAVHVRVDFNKCHKHHKHGVAECEKDEILTKLSPFCAPFALDPPLIDACFLLSLGLDKKINRTFLAKKVPIGIVNFHKLCYRLNRLGYTPTEIKTLMEGQSHGY